MKVYSKGHNPMLQSKSTDKLIHHQFAEKRVKGLTKVATLKKLIMKESHQSPLKNMNFNENGPKSCRDLGQVGNCENTLHKSVEELMLKKQLASLKYKAKGKQKPTKIALLSKSVEYKLQRVPYVKTEQYDKEYEREDQEQTNAVQYKRKQRITDDETNKENFMHTNIRKYDDNALKQKNQQNIDDYSKSSKMPKILINYSKYALNNEQFKINVQEYATFNNVLSRSNQPTPKMSISSSASINDFRLGRKIGRGRFGNVYIGQQNKTGAIYAIKAISIKQVKEEEMENQIIEEIKLQTFMNHPNVLKMYTFFKDAQQIYLVLEYCNEKCLYKKLKIKMSEGTAAYYIQQVIAAMKYFHSQNILHRDIKPENIMLCEGVVKVGDFGWAAYAPQEKRNTFCGTLDYVPPEIIRGDFYDEKVDIWSLGVLIYELTTGNAPFQCKAGNSMEIETQTMQKIIGGDLKIPNSASSDLRKLILRILIGNPQTRLSLEQIEESGWLKKYGRAKQIRQDIWMFWSRMFEDHRPLRV